MKPLTIRIIFYLIVLGVIVASLWLYFWMTTPRGPVISGGPVQGALIPDYWTKEETQIRGNEALLFSNGLKVELFKKSFGRYAENSQEMFANGTTFNKDIFSNELPRYTLHKDKLDFDLVATGPDGKYDTEDDVVFDRTRFANNLLPLFGGEDKVKIASMFESDRDYINSEVKKFGSKAKALPSALATARTLLDEGKLDDAMRAMNKAWLLGRGEASVYAGFADILEKQGKIEEANAMRALSEKAQ